MSRWCVWVERADPLEQHILPIDAKGEIAGNHVPRHDCWCRPQLDDGVDPSCGTQFVHNDPERGGHNA